ncbi:hypothetical protein ACWFMI_20380 [Nocardiopsis terrae]
MFFLVMGLIWLILATVFGRHVWIGPRRIRVNGVLSTTRLDLSDIRKVTVDEWGVIRIVLLNGQVVKATSHQRGPKFPFPLSRQAERAAAAIRRTARAARPRRCGPVTLDRSWWPVPAYLGLSLVFCLLMRAVFAQTY